MTDLGPKESAAIAKHVYAIRQESDVQTAMELTGGLGIRDTFAVDSGSRFEGSSGMLFFKKESGFGYVASGKGTRAGEALVVTRGTVSGFDWGSNLNVGMHMTPGGLVHAGFHDVFRTFLNDLKKYFRVNNPSHVHCVGHSLGGALATLTADYLSESKISGVSLYTFGCPRVGDYLFSKNLTRKLGAQNIHRVCHDADPVSMIPPFPFVHVPDTGPGLQLKWSGARVSASAHYMESYISSLGDSGWAALERSSPSIGWDQRISDWLDSASSEGVVTFSATTLWMIMKALGWLLKKILGGAVGITFTAAATILDQLAWLLHQGALMNVRIQESLVSIIQTIFGFLGRAASAVGDLTVAFVRWVLGLLWSSLQISAQRAVSTIPFI
jgi:triacylglycerol lipase